MSEIGSLLSDPDSITDPYPVYDIVRNAGRVLWVEEMGRWLVTGYAEAITVLGHEKVSTDRRLADGSEAWPEGGVQPRGLPFLDPPDHARLRGLVQQAFTLRRIQQLRPRVQDLVDDLLTAAAERGQFDLVADFAGPLPAIVLAELLGIPPEDHEVFRRWVTTVIETIDPVSHRLVSGEGAAERVSLKEYFTQIIAERRERPRDDLISGMVQAEADGEQLTGEEILEMCVVLTMAGLEAATNLIANGINALLRHPDQLARLRADPGLIRTGVEELLRFDAPVQVAGRIARADYEVAGQVIRRGQTTGVILGAANRDPLAFPEPGRLDVMRSPNNHLAFGRGIHFCLGAPLARLEGPLAISALITRFPGLRLDGEPKRRHNVHVRGFESFPVALT